MNNILNLGKNIYGDDMIKDIMSYKIISGSADDTFKDIASLMKKNNIGFIPIKKNNDFVGVITDRDICLAIPNLNNINDSIKSYITNNIVYIDINDSIKSALDTMSKYKVKRLLVKDDDKIVGVLSLSDILNYTSYPSIINTYKTIFYIHDNTDRIHTEIDEFYL